MFAISKKFFFHLGGYDPGLLVWGGENFELSFKVWQCGGRLVWVPCSRVGHVYRSFMPYTFGSLISQRKGPLIETNYKRVIEVWFDDEYKKYFYTRIPLAKYYDAEDISEQLELKKRLNCKSFDWFMKNVASDVFKDFPKLPPNVHWGELRSVKKGLCLQSTQVNPPAQIIFAKCHNVGGTQLLRLNKAGQLGIGERCVQANREGTKLEYCTLGTVDGPWSYDVNTMLLLNTQGGVKLCLKSKQTKIFLDECNENDEYQKWKWQSIKFV